MVSRQRARAVLAPARCDPLLRIRISRDATPGDHSFIGVYFQYKKRLFSIQHTVMYHYHDAIMLYHVVDHVSYRIIIDHIL